MKALKVGAVSVALIASVSYAGTQNDAGCGLGSMVFKENGKMEQVLASTTNGTAGSQTFGITTGTLNCGESAPAPAPAPKKRSSLKEQEGYVAANFRNLSREMAAGKGEYVSSFASLLGCDQAAFGKMTQSKYETLFPSSKVTPSELLVSVKGEIAKDSRLANSCSL